MTQGRRHSTFVSNCFQ